MRSDTRGAAAGLVLALLGGVTAHTLGDGYPDRRSSPRPGTLVAVADRIPDPPPPRPRRTVVVVADGLRRDFALGMRATARLAAAGQCRDTDTGAITISRAVYAVLSTGVEQDRTGVRDNSLHAPLAVESIWQIARDAGLVVVVRSSLTWWQELFPAAFSRTDVLDDDEPHFYPDRLGDLTLIHPGWVDVAGHASGAASPSYAAGVRRLDDEFDRFLDGIDLRRDLVVLTADHGHTDRGGHGGRSPEVAVVLTCFAGRGVAHLAGGRPIMALDVAPALALLLGLPFPRHMRARGDDLDELWRIVDPGAFPAAYLDDRRDAVARFREANPPWPEVYAAGRQAQALRLALVFACCLVVVAAATRRRRRPLLAAAALLVFMAATVSVGVIAQIRIFGGFDLSAVNKRELYVGVASRLFLAVAAVAFLLRLALARDLMRAAGDLAALVGVGLIVNLGLVWVFGAPLGFPLPTPRFLFLPVFAAMLTTALAAVLGLVSLVMLAMAWRRIYSSP